jgi:ribonuclease HI
MISGVGEMIFLNQSHSFSYKVRLGQGANNYVELMDLKITLTLVAEKGVTKLQIFGD